MADQPLLVFGPRSTTYDFGPTHPLTPRRFGPGIDLLRALGASPSLAPEPARDEALLACHTAAYVNAVRRFSEPDIEPWAGSSVGIGPGDDPPFVGMHDAAASVADGSIRAMDAILRGEVEHAFHPGGGLHHAMPARASGFCIYNDPALAIARARAARFRVLYVDLDVHHGDGVEAIHAADPGVLTLSIHESGRYLFPGTGFAWDLGEDDAAGTVVNVPLEPGTGEQSWLAAVDALLPELAASFAPDVIVSQHGCDTHATDPLAHLNVTTTAMGRAARLIDRVAHRFAGGRWLATGGGGYGVYRVVPRAWSHVWLAAAHREAPDRLPAEWRERWAGEAARYGDRELPTALDDPPNAGLPFDSAQAETEAASAETTALVRRVAVPRLIREAVDRGWWRPLDGPPAALGGEASGAPVVVRNVDATALGTLHLAARVVPGVDAGSLAGAVAAGELAVTAAMSGDVIVGLVASSAGELLAVGVAPEFRRKGLATRLLQAHVAERPGPWTASVTLAERDPIDPLPVATRAAAARQLLERAGFRVTAATGAVARLDPHALDAAKN
jgi:acetoin utilization protein AcuC